MENLVKIFDSLNIPKQLLDKSESLLKALFGPSFEEFSGLLADQVKLKRFNNQVKILTKAQERLRKNNINPQKVSLKVLAPLIEYSSLEEEENLQVKWSNLISNILGGDKDIVFHQNCITILSRISSETAKLLDQLHELLEKKRNDQYQRHLQYYNQTKEKQPNLNPSPPLNPNKYSLDSFTFSISLLSEELNIPISELEFSISNLISFGLLKWETDVDVSATKSYYDSDRIDVDVNVYNNINFIFTIIGDKFIKICKD